MQSDAADVDAYLLEVPEERREVLSAIRAACGELLTGFTESMRYGMPVYLRDDEPEVAWASQKQYIALYVMRTDVMADHREALAGLSVGKGCIRYRHPAQVDLDVVRRLLTATAATRAPVC